MPTETYTPAQAAAVLGVHANTVRSWTREYTGVLSDSAQARPRQLTPRDVALLQLVVQLRAEGLTQGAVQARLRLVPDTDVQAPYIEATAEPTAPPVASSSVPTVPATVDVSSVLRDMAAIVDVRTAAVAQDLRRLDGRVRLLESRRTLWVGFAIGAVSVLVLGLMLAAVLLRLL